MVNNGECVEYYSFFGEHCIALTARQFSQKEQNSSVRRQPVRSVSESLDGQTVQSSPSSPAVASSYRIFCPYGNDSAEVYLSVERVSVRQRIVTDSAV